MEAQQSDPGDQVQIRNAPLFIRVTPAERERIKSVAAEMGKTVSGLIRGILDDFVESLAKTPSTPPVTIERLSDQDIAENCMDDGEITGL